MKPTLYPFVTLSDSILTVDISKLPVFLFPVTKFTIFLSSTFVFLVAMETREALNRRFKDDTFASRKGRADSEMSFHLKNDQTH